MMPRQISYAAQLGAVLRQGNPRVLRQFLIDNAARFGDQRQVADLEATSDPEMEELLHRMIVARSDLQPLHRASREWLFKQGIDTFGEDGKPPQRRPPPQPVIQPFRASIISVAIGDSLPGALRQSRKGSSGRASIPSVEAEARHLSSSSEPAYDVIQDGDGSFRVEVTDEDGAMLPVVRQVTRAQADVLIERIKREARTQRQPIKRVIRDPYSWRPR